MRHVGGCAWCMCGWKMAKDVGMAIRKSIVVLFLPCLVAFLGFHPYMVLHFLKAFFVTCNLVEVDKTS